MDPRYVPEALNLAFSNHLPANQADWRIINQFAITTTEIVVDVEVKEIKRFVFDTVTNQLRQSAQTVQPTDSDELGQHFARLAAKQLTDFELYELAVMLNRMDCSKRPWFPKVQALFIYDNHGYCVAGSKAIEKELLTIAHERLFYHR